MRILADHFRMFAIYNGWANRRLYAAAAALSDEDYRADRGAFFGSVQGTLNHLLVADRIWMSRFTGAGPTYPRLDLILHEDLNDLGAAREAEDERIVSWVESLDDESLARSFTYRTIAVASEVTQPLAPALAHFFNHQTHHRGQVHALITATGGRAAVPELDLIYFQRETGIGIPS
jgi:uncharacterized damage-inducible protein DinB